MFPLVGVLLQPKNVRVFVLNVDAGVARGILCEVRVCFLFKDLLVSSLGGHCEELIIEKKNKKHTILLVVVVVGSKVISFASAGAVL